MTRDHYTLKPLVCGWTCYLTNSTNHVSGIFSAMSRRRRLSPGGLRVQRGTDVFLGTLVVIDARLLRAPLRIMEKKAVVVAIHDPAVFRPLWMELVVEGELGDVAGPGGNPACLLLQQLL